MRTTQRARVVARRYMELHVKPLPGKSTQALRAHHVHRKFMDPAIGNCGEHFLRLDTAQELRAFFGVEPDMDRYEFRHSRCPKA